MKCDRQALSEYYDGELVGAEREALERHLRECPECAQVLAEYRRVGQSIRSLPTQPPPASLESDIANRLADGARRSLWRRAMGPVLEMGAAAAAVVITIVVVGNVLQGGLLGPGDVQTAATPGIRSANVATNATIKVSFDREMDRPSVEAAVAITPSLKVDCLWHDEDLFLVPREPLRPATAYKVTVDSSARDVRGNALQTAFSLEFETEETVAEAPLAVVDNVTASATPVPAQATATAVAMPVGQPTTAPAPTALPTVGIAAPTVPAPSHTPVPAEVVTEPVTTTMPVTVTATVTATSPVTATAPVTPTVPATETITVAAVATPTSETGDKHTLAAGTTPSPTPRQAPPRAVITTLRPTRSLAQVYHANPHLPEKLGAAVAEQQTVLGGQQSFQNGVMLWRKDMGLIYVLKADGTSRRYDDLWKEGMPRNGLLTPPSDLYEPERGFGLVWREGADVRESLGWATTPERGFIAAIQAYGRGTMFETDEGVVYIMYSDGKWEQVSAIPPTPTPTAAAK